MTRNTNAWLNVEAMRHLHYIINYAMERCEFIDESSLMVNDNVQRIVDEISTINAIDTR